MSINFFYGQEYFLLENEIKKIKSECLNSDFIAMNYKIFDNPKGLELIDCCQNAPMMFGDMLSVIYVDKYLLGNDLSLTDEQLIMFENALKNVQKSVHLVFVCKIPQDELKKPDGRKKFFKILTNYANCKEFAKFRTYDKQLPGIIIGLAKDNGLKLSSSVCSYIIEQMGTDLTLINTEIIKLANAIYPRTDITKEDVKTFCTVTEDIFNLADTLISGNKDEILKQYNTLTEKEHPLKILSVLHGNFSKYIFIKNYMRVSDSDIAKKLGMNEYVVKLTKQKIANIPLDKLLKLQKDLTEAELKYKTGQALLPDLLMEVTLLR